MAVELGARLAIATHNMHKAREIMDILADTVPDLTPRQVVTSKDVGSVAPDETGSSFEENALIKARALARDTGLLSIADDSGLCVEVMNGSPGIFSARWAGTLGDDAENLSLLVAQLADIPVAQRGANFTCAAAAVLPDGTEIVKVARVEGDLTTAPRGTGGFGYDPIFMADGKDVTNAELSPNEKNAMSHRGQAFRALAVEIAKLIPSESVPMTSEIMTVGAAAAQAAAAAAQAAADAAVGAAKEAAAQAAALSGTNRALAEEGGPADTAPAPSPQGAPAEPRGVAATEAQAQPAPSAAVSQAVAEPGRETSPTPDTPPEPLEGAGSEPAPGFFAPSDIIKAGLNVLVLGPVPFTFGEEPHYYPAEGDQFWKLLASAGFTRSLIKSDEDQKVLSYSVGLTCDVDGIKDKVERTRPKWLAVNGKDVAVALGKNLGRPAPGFGVPEWQLGTTKIYVLPGSGADVVGPWGSKTSRPAWWKDLAELIRT